MEVILLMKIEWILINPLKFISLDLETHFIGVMKLVYLTFIQMKPIKFFVILMNQQLQKAQRQLKMLSNMRICMT